MITVRRTIDPELIKSLMWDDFEEVRGDWEPYVEPNNYFIVVYKDNTKSALLSFKKTSEDVVESHVCIKKEFRGAESYKLTLKALNWMRKNAGIRKFLAIFPKEKDLVKRYAEKCGFKLVSVKETEYYMELIECQGVY